MGLTSDRVKAEAQRLGFDLCGVASADTFSELALFREWIDRGYHGGMHYLARSVERRSDVRAVLPSARSVVVLGTLYNVDRPYSTEVADPDVARIARYAWGEDYHLVIDRRLQALIARMAELHGEPFDARPYVDTGPVLERAWAERAGLGWVGKNTCLIHPALGSFFFLSEILCSLPLEPDTTGVDQCGACTLCLEACPTQAFVEPYVMDARRCLSYVTIELKGPIPAEMADAVGPHVFGCDICQEVCPWNQQAPVSHDPAWQPRAAFDRPRLAALEAMSDDDLRQAMRGSAMKRTGVKGLRRNLAAGRRADRPAGE